MTERKGKIKEEGGKKTEKMGKEGGVRMVLLAGFVVSKNVVSQFLTEKSLLQPQKYYLKQRNVGGGGLM